MNSLLSSYETPEVIANLPAIEGALPALTTLATRYDLAIITSRKDRWRDATEAWFNSNFAEVSLHYATGRNNPFAGGSNRLHKPQAAEQVGALALTDDNEQEFRVWDSPTVQPICFAQPWNRSLLTTHPHIPRLKWPGIVDRYMS